MARALVRRDSNASNCSGASNKSDLPEQDLFAVLLGISARDHIPKTKTKSDPSAKPKVRKVPVASGGAGKIAAASGAAVKLQWRLVLSQFVHNVLALIAA